MSSDYIYILSVLYITCLMPVTFPVHNDCVLNLFIIN